VEIVLTVLKFELLAANTKEIALYYILTVPTDLFHLLLWKTVSTDKIAARTAVKHVPLFIWDSSFIANIAAIIN